MEIGKSVAGAAVAAALASLLTACSSGGGVAGDANTAPAPAASASHGPTTLARVARPDPSTAAGTAAAPRPAPAPQPAPVVAAPAAASRTPAAASHPSARPKPTGPVTFASVAFPKPFDCTQAGTGYYTAPDVTIAVDVTVLVNSAALTKDLVIAAPNRAPSGVSNASQPISAASLGDGVWRATYRTYASLAGPRYTPVTVSALQASDGTRQYAIVFSAPLSVTFADCHS